MANIAIITARSGSKGLKDKNIRLLAGKPLLVYSIEAAIKSGKFDTVMVSTDSEEYADIARAYGAEVPFLRSENTSSDFASSWDVVSEVLNRYHDIGKDYDTFMLLQPTSPLRTSDDICNAYDLYHKKNANSIVSVCKADHSPLQYGTLPEDLSLTEFVNGLAKGKRRQDLKDYYRINGAVYLANVVFFMEKRDIYSDKCYAYVMDRKQSVDIDDLFDFELTEALLNINEGKY